MLKKIKFKISGMHCQGCKTLIEAEMEARKGIKGAAVNHVTGEAEFEFDDNKIGKEEIFKEIEKLNYKPEEQRGGSVGFETASKSSSKSFVFVLTLLILFALFILGYFFISKGEGFEMLSKLNEGNVGYGLIFIIGLLSGFHCVGMCGGLVVAYCVPNLKDRVIARKINLDPHLRYNAGRLISYAAIGGILGGIGSFFGINPFFTGAITVVAGIFMILMGLSFIMNWPLLEKIKLRTPQFIAKYIFRQKNKKNSKGPFVVGLLTGFMPCGPLQAMQLYALASGSVLRGSASLAVFALGSAPILLGFGAAISSFGQRHIKNIIKISGILIIALGLFMANRGLANFGLGFKFFSYQINIASQNNQPKNNDKEYQIANMELAYLGYKPNVLYIKKGQPVRWVINVKEMSGCTNAIMIESLGIKKDLQYGENIVEFTPPEGVSEIKFSCWMRMVWGKFIIVENKSSDSGAKETRTVEASDGSPKDICGFGGSDCDISINKEEAPSGACH